VRVALDGRKLHDFGIGTHIQGLLRGFAELGCPEELVVYRPPGSEVPPALETAGTIAWREESAPPYSLAELWRLAVRARRDRAELFHAPHYVCPPVLSCPAVVTVHDLIHLRFADWRRRPLVPIYARVMLRLAVRRAARLITVSEATRADLARCLGVPAGRVRVIPNGVAPHFRPADDPARLAARLGKLGLASPYWLFVGNPMPHKNVPRLLDAYAGLPATTGPLVLAGVRATAGPALERAIEARALRDRVVILPPLPEPELPPLYQGATALVLVSLWEGFGLPALEAMACGTPVVVADRGGVAEVVGEAGLRVDPTNVDALREALYNLAVNAPLRAALRAAGLVRAGAFSWRYAAEATAAVYREALAGRPGEPR
jgi:glycosyltransferase involved in cell wall biosynthesis